MPYVIVTASGHTTALSLWPLGDSEESLETHSGATVDAGPRRYSHWRSARRNRRHQNCKLIQILIQSLAKFPFMVALISCAVSENKKRPHVSSGQISPPTLHNLVFLFPLPTFVVVVVALGVLIISPNTLPFPRCFLHINHILYPSCHPISPIVVIPRLLQQS